MPALKTGGLPGLPTLPAKLYRILIVDDHALVRRGIRSLLESQPGLEVCGEASTGAEAMEHIKKSKPDLVVLDLTMPEMNGLDVARAIKVEVPEIHILILTMHFSDELAREVLRSGALAYVLKSDTDTELLAAVDNARHHQPFFTSKLTFTMAQNFVQGPGEGEAGANSQGPLPGTPLTEREIEVVHLLAEGKSNKEVAAALGVSTRTVESHRNHIMRKMNFSNFSEMVRFAIRNNLVEA